jgi:hypothetical protein
MRRDHWALGAAAAAGVVALYARRRQQRITDAALAMSAHPTGSQGWTAGRSALARLLRQGNTYATWSLALRARRFEMLFYDGSLADVKATVSPADLGVTASTSLKELKRLDLGGRDQRQMVERLDANDRPGAERLFPEDTHIHILTGGALATRLERRRRLSEAFPHRRFVVVDPETEGRCTLLSVEQELRRLLSEEVTHVLLVAKGSTDLHLAWLDAGGAAVAPGCSTSAVHCLRKGATSSARDLFLAFMARPANAALTEAFSQGRGAVVFAGASIHAIGKDKAAAGNYFRPLAPPHDFEGCAAADFERSVGRAYDAACFVGARL